ncbi:MAG: hypothetical protein IJI83_01660 [Oscillospiraceae bacterium]|nr:hypothetical protein [Oscillospiraceae bacterium]
MQIRFRTIELRSPRRVKMKVVPELPEGYESLSNFVATEVESFAEQVREVLDGDSNGFSGNRYELVSDGKTVYISDTFGEEAECSLSLEEFDELIQAWVSETQKVRKEDQEENKLLKVFWEIRAKYPEISRAQYGGLTADHSEMLECLLLVGSREEMKEMEISGKAEEIRKTLSDALRRIGWERGKYQVSLSYVE